MPPAKTPDAAKPPLSATSSKGAVVEHIAALEKTVLRRMDALCDQLDSFDQLVRDLDRRVTVSQTNMVPRSANSTVRHDDARLEPMMSYRTGAPIERFPENLAEIDRMKLRRVNELLAHLGVAPADDVEVGRAQLMNVIGVVLRAI